MLPSGGCQGPRIRHDDGCGKGRVLQDWLVLLRHWIGHTIRSLRYHHAVLVLEVDRVVPVPRRLRSRMRLCLFVHQVRAGMRMLRSCPAGQGHEIIDEPRVNWSKVSFILGYECWMDAQQK